MSRSPNQKLKLLYLARILISKTDEEHAMSLEEIKRELLSYDVQAERKSLYDDMESLRTFGIDVQSIKSKTTRYYVASREFELPELKLLVDSVQANQFLTTKKTYTLIKKLESLCSQYEAQLMRRQVYVTNRIKTMNESIFYRRLLLFRIDFGPQISLPTSSALPSLLLLVSPYSFSCHCCSK